MNRGLMRFRITFSIVAALGLGSCSYSYNVWAEMEDGQLVFTSDKDWFRERCVREVDVVADDRENAVTAEEGDDAVRVGYGTFWAVRMDYHCENRFPVAYGASFKGNAMPGVKNGLLVSPKPLKEGIVYEVTTVSGATGYGGGHFMLKPDGSVVNVGY